jgi:large subunit ribosomal protein L3
MSLGLLGRKIGMTRVFKDNGEAVPVTVILIDNNKVTQIKTVDTDNYSAIQVTAGQCKNTRVTKPLQGHFKKANVEAGSRSSEFRLDAAEEQYTLGQTINIADVFTEGQIIDVTGVSKGKGFAGTVKRHNFGMQDATHGNSRSHRVPGSIGQNQTPGRVFKGKKMAGHMGNKNVTTQGIEIIKIDLDRALILVKGSVPGCNNSVLKLSHTSKGIRN